VRLRRTATTWIAPHTPLIGDHDKITATVERPFDVDLVLN
jgi:hypothetical protein